MSEIRDILVPVDFSTQSLAALRRAVDLARLFGARLAIFHCYALPVGGVTPYQFAVPAGIWDAIREESLERLERMRAEVAAQGVEVTVEGSPLLPTQAIPEEAAKRGSDLIVMGSLGRTGLAHVLLGSVAERTLRHAPCPVLIVKEAEEGALRPLRRVLVALDFSEPSHAALETGIDFARRLGAELHVVHAFDLPVPIVAPYDVSMPTTLIAQARDTAARKLEKALQKVRGGGLAGESHLAEAPVAMAIVRVAEEIRADLLVLGTHGYSGLKHVLLGSVAERTVRHAPCSVLTVHLPKESAPRGRAESR